MKHFILNIVKKIETLNPDLFVYAYRSGNVPMTNVWWQISVSDYNFYKSEQFSNFCRVWHKVAKTRGLKIIFVCGWIPKEEELIRLTEENNLIMTLC